MKEIIRTENLCFEYKDEESGVVTEILKNVSVSVGEGEFVALLGHNGSGKSTFAKLLNAILVPASGKIYVDGTDTTDESKLYELRKKVGLVFQNPDNQMVANIVEDDVAFAPENLGIEREEIRRRVDSALSAVNMTQFSKHAPHMLSRGQKQRVAIAGVLSMEPDILVLDEPTAMLDPMGRKEIIQTVKKLNKEKNITVVFITHYMEEAIEADRIIVIDDGAVVEEGTPKEIFSKVDKMKAMGLDTPQAASLVYRLNKDGFETEDTALTVDECVNRIMGLWKGKEQNK